MRLPNCLRSILFRRDWGKGLRLRSGRRGRAPAFRPRSPAWVIGGLLASTLVTLVLIPALYVTATRAAERWGERLRAFAAGEGARARLTRMFG